MKKVILLGCLIGATGCTGGGMGWLNSSPEGYVDFRVQGDAAGVQAAGDMLNGLITNGKASPDTDTPYWQNRQHENTWKLSNIFKLKPITKQYNQGS